MKTTATAMSALLAATAWGASASALDTVNTGFVDLSYAYNDLELSAGVEGDSVDADATANLYRLGGAWATKAGERFYVQFDGSVTFVDGDDIDVTVSSGGVTESGTAELEEATTIQGQAHLFGRNGESGSAGAFVNYTDNSDADFTAIGIGVEAAGYTADVTYQGQLAVFDIDEVDEVLFGGAGQIRGYLSDNASIEAGLAIASIDGEALYSAGVEGELQFGGSNASAFASLDYTQADFGDDGVDVELDGYTALVGVRFNFGPGTLKGRDRYGASMVGGRAILSDTLVNGIGAVGSIEDADSGDTTTF